MKLEKITSDLISKNMEVWISEFGRWGAASERGGSPGWHCGGADLRRQIGRFILDNLSSSG